MKLKLGLPGRQQVNHWVLLAGLAVSPMASTYAEEAQSQSYASPYYGADKGLGWHFDSGLISTYSDSFSSEGGRSSNSEFDGFVRFNYNARDGLRYFGGLNKDAAQLGAWWDWREDISFGAALDYRREAIGKETSLSQLQEDVFNDSSTRLRITATKKFSDFTLIAGLSKQLQDKKFGAGSTGIGALLGARWDKNLRHDLRLSASIMSYLGDDDDVLNEYGVTIQQYAKTGLRAYNPGSGLKRAVAGLELEYELNDNWSATAQFDITYFPNEISASPLLRAPGQVGSESTDNLYQLGLGVRYLIQ